MARRINVSRLRNQLRQADNQRRRAVQKVNSEIRKYNNQARAHNARVNTAINTYNRQVRQYNARVRANQSRLQSAFQHLSRQTVTVRYTIVYRSTLELAAAYETLNTSNADPFLSDLAERETANSAQVLNSLLEENDDPSGITTDSTDSKITHVLATISPDLNNRWDGALFALDPNNPDAARHFCASSREIITAILDIEAPNADVIQLLPNCQLTPQGMPTRRSKMKFLLCRQGSAHETLEEFADANISDVVNLFQVLNTGTHGAAGAYSTTQLTAIKDRVEGAIEFICAVARP
ncbi:MAG: hypothetical protein F4X16_13360 [Caldilineaceae bacterium SB0661_bin_34]|nr:hypothetical protein [Caldilineaceae bacterium SB0661_bin_34]